MGGERDLEAGMVGQEMQVSTENVATLVAPEIVQEQVQVGGDVGETYVANKIEVDLEKTILMIEIQENVVPTLVLEEENTNEDVNFMPKLMEVIY